MTKRKSAFAALMTLHYKYINVTGNEARVIYFVFSIQQMPPIHVKAPIKTKTTQSYMLFMIQFFFCNKQQLNK